MALSRTALSSRSTRVLRSACLALVTLIGTDPYAHAAEPAPPPQDAPVEPEPELVPPRPLAPPTVAYPEHAPPLDAPLTVRVIVSIDATGAVIDARPAPGHERAPGAFEDAVIAAARALRFSPATLGGEPIAVDLPFTHTFLPPVAPAETPEDTAAPAALLRGRLIARGTHERVAIASVVAVVDGESHVVDAGLDGHFRLPLPPGEARVTVRAPGYRPFLQREILAADEDLEVVYALDAERYDPYEIVVVADRPREEVSRLELRGRELKQVPGTFGDPFRVVQTLPGVGSVISLLPLPIVRGASPGSTGFLLDGVRVPLLYHLLTGPAVVHPELVEEVAFFPGGFPAPYGGYTAGIVDGRTRRARPEERLVDIDLNLTQAGALVRQPLWGQTFTVAGRWGYPGPLLELATDGESSLSYWDYQLRVDGGTTRQGYTVFAYGASDTVEALVSETDDDDATGDDDFESAPERLRPVLTLRFHRLDLRWYQRTGAVDGTYRVVLGHDESITGLSASVRTLSIEPRISLRWPALACLELRGGIEANHRDVQDLGITPVDSDEEAMATLSPGRARTSGSVWVEGLWRPLPELLVRPGVRADLRADDDRTALTLDPRLTLRYRVAEGARDDGAPPRDDDGTWLEASVGLYHQPPRLFVPLPGIDELPLRYGQLESLQVSLGADLPLTRDWRLEIDTYYNAMDPVIFDLSVNQDPTEFDGYTGGSVDEEDVLDRLLRHQVGRALGLELMLRKRDTGRGLHGWLAYTLSLSERRRDGVWVPFDFDRTHLLNAVIGLTLPRNWSLGVRVQLQSGKPVTTSLGYNAVRGEGFVRVDLRIDKHAVWNDWILDFYLDLINVAVMPEEVAPGNPIGYVLPTLGVRGRF